MLAHCPSSAALATGTDVGLHPSEAEKLGVAGGDQVRILSARGSIVLGARLDPGVARGIAHVRLAGGDTTPFSLLDSDVDAHWVRLEVVG
jgi:anaerobic selenocysteine-containing dehydrogenase